MNILKIFTILSSFLFFTYPVMANPIKITDEAQNLYQKYQSRVYQIRVIDLATGKKSSIGSGFQISRQGHIATNYHVVSQAIHSPDRFRIEYFNHEGATGELQMLDVDVIHDIAIVKSNQNNETFLELGKAALLKGTRMFSMGNPLDLGMTIVEGTFNGMMERSLYQKILFSGSLNSGMSGGPALGYDGKVIGMNVSTTGNQVSFLVPVDYLEDIYENALKNELGGIKNWEEYIEEQLIDNQNNYINTLLSANWESHSIGDASVPGELSTAFKCWGSSEDQQDKLFNYASIDCSSEDNIFLSSSFSTGKISYSYNWFTGKKINPIRFYNIYASYYGEEFIYENAQKDDVTNFDCNDDFVTVDQQDWRVSLCVRNYKKYPKLYDIHLSMASVNRLDKGLFVEVIALGISKAKSFDFISKFMGEIKWEK